MTLAHRSYAMTPLILLVLACQPADDSAARDTGPDQIAYSPDLPILEGDIGKIRGFVPLRSIIHLHSPWSHDACDGHGYEDGVLDEECLAEEREALCRLSIDAAYLSDHPSHAALQPFEDTLLMRDDDEPVSVNGQLVASRIHCAGGHEVLWLPGFEDELMPVGVEGTPVDPGEALDTLYNQSDLEAIEAMASVGGIVLQAHPEERSLEELERRQDDGLQGVELFNLHAMLSPETREDIYGLDAFGWIEDIGPFTDEDSSAEPDLLFLAFYQEQGPNLERWDHLSARAPTIGIAATDAHRNVMPIELADGERPDGFRRNMRWFSNHLLASERSVTAADAALEAGRLYAAFEIFGTPAGLDFHYSDADGGDWEMGTAPPPGGSLHLSCPGLSPSSPRDGSGPPEISGAIYKDGALWQEGCGAWEITEPGVYRARIDIVPSHLAGFLGDDPEPYLHSYPWVYTNPIRVVE
jgi:hypothetical protein